MSGKITILFVCTGNACRSQMAEAWARHLRGDVLEPRSAGTDPGGLDPLAVRAMAEVGVDMSAHRSKHVNDVTSFDPDYVVTLCDHAREHCPFVPGRTRALHVAFADPAALARSARSPQEALGHYRRVRDQIRAFVETLPAALGD